MHLHLHRDDGLDADGIVDELKEIRLLRRIAVVHEKARRDLAAIGIEHVPGVPASDPPPPRNHLPPIPVVAKQLNNAFHALPFLPATRRHFLNLCSLQLHKFVKLLFQMPFGKKSGDKDTASFFNFRSVISASYLLHRDIVHSVPFLLPEATYACLG